MKKSGTDYESCQSHNPYQGHTCPPLVFWNLIHQQGIDRRGRYRGPDAEQEKKTYP